MNRRRFVLLIDLGEYQVKVKTEKKQIKRRSSPVQERVKNLSLKFSEKSLHAYYVVVGSVYLLESIILG